MAEIKQHAGAIEGSKPLVLDYASPPQERWERGELWLVCVLAVAYLLLLLPRAYECSNIIASNQLSLYPWRMTMMAMMLVGSLSLAASAMMALLRIVPVGQARRLLRIVALFLAAAMVIYGINAILFFLFFTQKIYFSLICHEVCELTLRSYPLVMLVILLGRGDRVRMVQWLTAIAMMLVGAAWLLHYESRWRSLTYSLSLHVAGRNWWDAIQGIGLVSAIAACACVYGIVLWMIVRRRRGDKALMICAALWIIYAVGFSGTDLVTSLYSYFWGRWPLYRASVALEEMVLVLAFALTAIAAMRYCSRVVDEPRRHDEADGAEPGGCAGKIGWEVGLYLAGMLACRGSPNGMQACRLNQRVGDGEGAEG